MTEEDYYEEDDYEDEEESDGFILSFDEGVGAKLTPKKEYENIREKQDELITEFVKENTKLFVEFLEKKGISEDEFNGIKSADKTDSEVKE